MSTIAATNLKNASSGSNNIVLEADGRTTVAAPNILKLGTSVASTSGTSIDFTGIPSWVKRVTVMLSGVSKNGLSSALLQLGHSGGIENSGYLGTVSTQNGTVAAFSAGFQFLISPTSSDVAHGIIQITGLGSNVWASTSMLALSSVTGIRYGAGSKTLSSTLTQLRITAINGTDTFSAGSINILWEG